MPFRDQASERRGPDAPIEVELAAQSASELYCDIGGTIIGVFASTFIVCERDAHVQLILWLYPDRSAVRASGVVQFVRTANDDQLPGLGVAFTELEPDARHMLAQFAERVRAPMLYDE